MRTFGDLKQFIDLNRQKDDSGDAAAGEQPSA